MNGAARNSEAMYQVKIYGIVQGVGFRPFIRRLALKYGIRGTVCNKGSYVEILASGSRMQAFLSAIPEEAPARSAILKIRTQRMEEEILLPEDFQIVESEKDKGLVFVSPDIATCPECERELFDLRNRRYLHPFINCTACGPRLTILDSMPYDRVRTSMGEFPMCPACHREYTDLASRRYHAQPVCCRNCGPELYLLGRPERGDAALEKIRRIIRNGGIVAIKGIGGFHLCCDGTNDEAVQRLRKLKHRPYKPFAVMMRDMETVRRTCVVPEGVAAILQGPQKPILLLEKKGAAESEGLSPALAPGNPSIGVMLPYTPVHMLLFRYPDAETESMPAVLVMTSGNPAGAPICMTDGEAEKYLLPMCDAILSNSRKIRIRADDSVMSFYRNKPYMIRHSRGYAPLPTVLPQEYTHSVLGIGGELKNTFALLKGDMAYLSPYIGDMADLRSVEALHLAEERMERLLEIRPECIVTDLHPKYNTGEVARVLAEKKKIPLYQVQHHYAHILSCMAENECMEPVIGIAFDGTGFGPDGTIWGGEILLADGEGFRRMGSIRPFIHAGGDRASREGWRIAAAILPEKMTESLNLGTAKEWAALRFMMGNQVNTILSTSMGRIFDGVSAILGLKEQNSFEGEMSMQLQFEGEKELHRSGANSLSVQYKNQRVTEEKGFLYLETNALVQWIAERKREGVPAGQLALLFHEVLADMVRDGALRLREITGVNTVALSGGVFQNLLLLELCQTRLEKAGFRVLIHSLVPANDGGIALGQAVYGAVQMEQIREDGTDKVLRNQ